MTRIEFVQKFLPLVKQLGEGIGIFPETVFAQAIVESGNNKGEFGKSPLADRANNYFGIKANSTWKGKTYTVPTKEYSKSGQLIGEVAKFRAYDSIEDSIKDYFKFLVGNKRYREAGVFDTSNWREQVKALMKAGYAGENNTHYAGLLTKVGNTVETIIGKVTDAAGSIFAGSEGKEKKMKGEATGASNGALIGVGVIILGGALYLLNKK